MDFLKKEQSLLIIEAEINLRDYLFSVLGVDYEVSLESKAEQAIEKVQLKQPNLILIDFDLPNQEGQRLLHFFKNNEATKHLPLLGLSKSNLLEDKIKAIHLGVEAFIVKPFSLKLLKATIAQILFQREILLQKYSLGLTNVSISTGDKKEEVDRVFMQNVLSFVQNKLNDQDLNVEIMASHFLLSRSQFYRKIKAKTGVSPNELIRKVRLEKAKKLLEINDLNVNEVIYEVGFSSSSYFAKCFKKEFGYLPMEVKKE